jgi:hypothetical protein
VSCGKKGKMVRGNLNYNYLFTIRTYFVFENTIRADYIIENTLANMSVHCAERVIKQVNVSVRIDTSGQADALLLPSGQINPLKFCLKEVAF